MKQTNTYESHNLTHPPSPDGASRQSPHSNAADIQRVFSSLCEEFEAVGLYHERMLSSDDPRLKEMFKHHRNEEIEHGVMALEWLRQTIPELDTRLRNILFEATDREQAPSNTAPADHDSAAGLRIHWNKK